MPEPKPLHAGSKVNTHVQYMLTSPAPKVTAGTSSSRGGLAAHGASEAFPLCLTAAPARTGHWTM